MSGGGFYLDLRIRKDGYAWAAWRMVICLCRMRLLEMTPQLMEWSDATLMKEGGKGSGKECEMRRLEEEANKPK